MAQLTLQLDAETALEVQRAAEREGLSQSEWVTRLVEAQLKGAWPDAVVQLAGAWPDFPEAEAIRRGYKKQGDEKDLPRETL